MEAMFSRGAFVRLGIALLATWPVLAVAADPQVTNVQAAQRAGTKLVDITYDVTATGAVSVAVTVSTNSGASYDLTATSFTGDVGSGVAPGSGKAIVWDAGADWGGQFSALMRVKVTADDGSNPPLPPDPATVATAPSNGVVTLIGQSTVFLYTGTNAIQTGVATGVIDLLRVAVLRGRTLDQDGAPLSGVKVTVNNHAELGQTLTRTNGEYDLAVNGGGPVSINFAKTGYLAIQRTLDAPWQDYVAVPDVVLKTADTNVMVARLPSTSAQAVYGSIQTDADGVRRAMVIIPANTRAYVFTAAGTTQETSTLTTCLTEFTVGTNGPAAMPGDLPSMVGYTYALELAAEEAQVKIAGRSLLFSTNVFFYVDNFLGMPTGIQVPMGYYDDTAAAWIPSEDGRVVQLAGTNASGLAEVIVGTNGVPADAGTLAAMGFTDAERLLLVAQYGPAMTQSLWRVPIAHFSWHDPNYGMVSPGATAANMGTPSTGNLNQPTGQGNYGRLDLENQVFQEEIALVGSPLKLHYSSARAPGFLGDSSITIPLSGTNISPLLRRIHLQVSIAGLTYTNSYAPDVNLYCVFNWTGVDAYQRALMGTLYATVRIGYEYLAYYALPPSVVASFGYPSGTLVPGDVVARDPLVLWQEHQVLLRTSSLAGGLGGWSLSKHHLYDPVGKVLHLGDGTDRNANATYAVLTARSIAGNGTDTYSGDSGPATDAGVGTPEALAVGPNGTVYNKSGGWTIVRGVDTNGIIRRVAGGGTGEAGNGDGGPATNAVFNIIQGIAVGPDGSLYICDSGDNLVRCVGTNGIIRTVAGNGTAGFSGDGGPATNAAFYSLHNIAVARDGTMYITDPYNYRVRVVSPAGIIRTVAGNGTAGFSGDGGPATNAVLSFPFGCAMAPDGAVYVSDSYNNRVRRIGTDGIITTVAGNGTASFSGDGGAATNAGVDTPWHLAVNSDGTLYISDIRNHIRAVTSDGIIRTVAGTGNSSTSFVDNAPPLSVDLDSAGLAVGPDGAIYCSAYHYNRIIQITRDMPGVGSSDILIAAADGNRFYQFDPQGRHLKTYNAWTGAALLEFGYTNGYLSSVTDGDGNQTRIVRSGGGAPQEIVTPDNQHTLLALNANGFLSAVQNPAGETFQLSYTTNGLLTAVQGPRGASCAYAMSYNPTGQIVSASDPAGGSMTLRRAALTNGYEVSGTTAMGRAFLARAELLPAGDLRRTQVLPDGAQRQQWQAPSGMETNQYPDGTLVRWTERPDPRFGMQVPVQSNLVVRLPSGLAMTASVSRAVTLTNQSWASLASLTNTVTVNGRAYAVVYAGASRQLTLKTPANRQFTSRFDAQGRLTWREVPGLEAITNSHDDRGRWTGETVGAGAAARTLTVQYDASSGFVSAVGDPVGRTWTYACDAAGQVTNVLLPDGNALGLGYDAHGNVTSVKPPGRPAHSLTYNQVDQLASYAPAVVDGVTNTSTYEYNQDRQLTLMTRPDERTLSVTYDSAGRRTGLALSGVGSYTLGYAGNGLLGTNTAPSGVSVAYGYDGFLATSERYLGGVTGSLAYTYDNAFRLSSFSVNGGSPTVFQYDPDGLLTNAGGCGFARDAVNGMWTATAFSNYSDSLFYNGFAELTNYSAECNGTNLYACSQYCDKAGRVTSRAEVVEGVTNGYEYTYDSAGHLVRTVTNGIGTNAYAYDANGNRTNWTVNGALVVATYDDQDRLLTFTGGTNQYNASGDLTNKTAGGLSTAYAYDVLGNLLGVRLPGGTTIEYMVDGFGRRVGKKADGAFVKGFLYMDLLRPVAELGPATNLVSVFVYGNRLNVPEYMAKTGTTYRIVCDPLGSVRLVVDVQSGAVAQRLDYDEWGRVTQDTNPGFQPFGFAGGLYDADTSLVRFGVRDYDPESGRWTCRDPVGFAAGSANLYAYLDSDPLNGTDMAGLGPKSKSRSPDIYSVTLGFWVVSGSLAMDAYGNLYFGAGAGFGKAGAWMEAGQFDTAARPSAATIEENMKGWSGGANIFVVLGGSHYQSTSPGSIPINTGGAGFGGGVGGSYMTTPADAQQWVQEKFKQAGDYLKQATAPDTDPNVDVFFPGGK